MECLYASLRVRVFINITPIRLKEESHIHLKYFTSKLCKI